MRLALPLLAACVAAPSVPSSVSPAPTESQHDSVEISSVEKMLWRSIAPEIGLEHARLRVRAARALAYRVIDHELALALADNAVLWLKNARDAHQLDLATLDGCVRGRDSCTLLRALFDAVEATRDLLDRSSASSVPVRRLRSSIAPGWGCEEDPARIAVVQNALELFVADPGTVYLPRSTCRSFVTIGGPRWFKSVQPDAALPYRAFAPAVSVQGETPHRWNHPSFDEAPLREVQYAFHGARRPSGDRTQEYGAYLVALVDGEWRVLQRTPSLIIDSYAPRNAHHATRKQNENAPTASAGLHSRSSCASCDGHSSI